ncbi:MAG: acyl-CoA desaturase [Prochloraceae cyanobacterium]|nr:acyl-CoA desaturase [Prochloraceae cyanobacterium]
MALIAIITPLLGSIAAFFWFGIHGINSVDLSLCLGMYAITTLGITAGFHRLFTHRSFATGKVMQILLGIAGSMAVQGPVLFWAASHRRHHQNSDRPDDPHSPNIDGQGIPILFNGFWHAHIGWMLNHNSENWVRYIPDLLRDKLIFRLNQWYFYWIFLGLLIPAILGGLLTWTWQGILSGLLWGGFLRIFLVHHTTWSINSICHLYGSRPYETKDESTNNFLCALLTFGEGWHNNHHAFPTSARHGLKWWQIDITYLVIYLLEKGGLVWNLKIPNSSMLEAKISKKVITS